MKQFRIGYWRETAAALAFFLLAADALGAITVVNPTGANHVSSLPLTSGATTGTIALNPDQVSYLSGASATFKNQVAADFPTWNFSFASGLAGTLTVNQYQATSKGGLNGGALLDMTYTRAGTDPAIANLFWIQMVSTNSPLGGTTSPYIDPRPNDDTLPFYWTLAEDTQAANGNKTASTYHFFDNSSRNGSAPTSSTNWNGNLMLASWDQNTTTRQVTVYDGISWGWNLNVPSASPVPEPSSLAGLSLGLVMMLVWLRRKGGVGV